MSQFTITQLTDNNLEDDRPAISGNNVVWDVDDGNDTEIVLYDGNNITQITDNDLFDSSPSVSGDNIAWFRSVGEDAVQSSGEIVLYDILEQ